MIKLEIKGKTSINRNETRQGEYIENKIRRIVYNNEAITDSAPIIYNERKEGVLPQHNIRTDRWDIAIEKMDRVNEINRNKYLTGYPDGKIPAEETADTTAE